MIKAENKTVFKKVFRTYNTSLLRRSFHRIWITSTSYSPDRRKGGIYLVNHSSWWDPLILFYLNDKKLNLNAIAMMDEEGLNRFPFFRKLGAFSVNSSSAKSLLNSLKYASEELKDKRHLFLFPQGGEEPLEKRPYKFFQGAAYLHDQNPDIPVIPVSFYHGFFHHQLPEWFIHIGRPIELKDQLLRSEKTALFENASEKQADMLREIAINEKRAELLPLLKGVKGTGARWEELKQRFRKGAGR